LLVGLEKIQEGSALVVGFPVGGEQFAAESEFLRLTAIAEVEQFCVQQLRINVSGFPCDIEVSGVFLIGGEASIEIDFAAP
jgi:hypothetical protein